jgi:molecular chaperone HscB
MTHVPKPGSPPSAVGGVATLPVKCASCDRPLDSPLVCVGCRALYSSEGLSHFQLLGIEPRFDLDAGELRRRYLALTREIHPDRGAAQQQDQALRCSAALNEAYEVLRRPQKRAEYLLELLGGPSAATDRSVEQSVLTETLLLSEELQEAHAAGDAAALESVRRKARARRDELAARSEALTRQLPGDESLRADLRAALNAWKYFARLSDED